MGKDPSISNISLQAAVEDRDHKISNNSLVLVKISTETTRHLMTSISTIASIQKGRKRQKIILRIHGKDFGRMLIRMSNHHQTKVKVISLDTKTQLGIKKEINTIKDHKAMSRKTPNQMANQTSNTMETNIQIVLINQTINSLKAILVTIITEITSINITKKPMGKISKKS